MSTEETKNAAPWLKGVLDRTEDEHVIAADHQFHGLGSVVQMTRLLRDATGSQQDATNKLTARIHSLNKWLLGVTFAIAVMTVVQVLVALGVITPVHMTKKLDLPVEQQEATEAETLKRTPPRANQDVGTPIKRKSTQ